MSAESTKKSKKENTRPGWLSLDRYDFFCSLYVAWFFFASVIWFQGSPDLETALGINANHDRLLILYSSFLALILFSQTILGFKGSLIGILRLYAWPGYIFYYSSSFTLQARKTFKKLRSNFPAKLLFFSIIPVLYYLGMYSTNQSTLKVVMPLLSAHLVFSLMWGVRWSLNPFNFLKHANFLQNTKIRSSIILNFVKPDKKEKELTFEGLLKKVDSLKKLVTAYEVTVSKLASNRTLFVCFLSVLFIVSAHIIVGGAVLLRVFHTLSLPGGVIHINDFFSGDFLDFLYVSINSFLPNDLHGIEFINKNARWILTAITSSSYALLVIAMAGFSMAGSSKVEETVTNLTKDMHGAIEEAASILGQHDAEKKSQPQAIEHVPSANEKQNPIVRSEFVIYPKSKANEEGNSTALS